MKGWIVPVDPIRAVKVLAYETPAGVRKLTLRAAASSYAWSLISEKWPCECENGDYASGYGGVACGWHKGDKHTDEVHKRLQRRLVRAFRRAHAPAPVAGGQEFRVSWKRRDSRRKVKVYKRRSAAERFMLNFGPEPWLARGKDPDALWCCPGTRDYECGCGGVTVRVAEEEARQRIEESVGPLEYVRLESRVVGPWGPP